ncbi:uncharacterized protein LOC135221863 isoform X1 [Macrobrachium nipponense]|uniref:uncharacterized protein LOC135221863 isoform X1 n=1 Tax=Macrobrachium nipponense TaxID=159736 RepID=UPI0030C7B44D
MGKIKKEYREEKMESYGYTSHTSESSQSSGSSESSSSDSESSGSTGRKRKHIKKKSKYKREKKKRSDSEEEVEYVEREKRKKRKHAKHKDADEASPDEEHARDEERKHRSRKHNKHHHRKHKHKHRRHRHHRSEEEYQEKRREASLERTDNRKEREDCEERKAIYEKGEKDRKNDREGDRRNKKEEKRSKERGESSAPSFSLKSAGHDVTAVTQVKSKWDDDDDDVQSNVNKRIKPDVDADAEESREHSRVKQEKEVKKRRDKDKGSENGRWGMANVAQNVKNEENNSQVKEELQKPNMGLSGKLSEDTNTFNGVVIKYSQPPEARKPKRRWRWYIFKGEEDLPFLPLHRQSAYLIGRDRKVADIPTDHPSCSKQHAVLQYRLVSYEREDGTKGRTVKPYILDLESANGTYVNNRRIDPRRFVELVEKDVVKFGYSSREYILLHEGSKGDDADVPDMGVDLSPVSLLRS